MAIKINWDDPIRFVAVQDDDHLIYKPKFVGSFVEYLTGDNHHVIVTRNWKDSQGNYAFVVYDDYGQPRGNYAGATSATGIFNLALINGPRIYTVVEVTNSGLRVNVTYEGDKVLKVKLA